MKLSFSLAGAKAKPKTASSVGAAPPLKKPAAFSALEDDSELVADAAPGIGDHRDVSANKRLLAQSAGAGSSKAQKKRMEAERQVDATVFEYDEVYDHMKAAKERQKASKDKDQDGTKRQPKYMTGLLNSAATRRLDHLRAEEKMLQREREAEGDMYAEKEEFVTDAYKKQMAEVRAAEEEEKKRDEAERKKYGGQPKGLAALYQKMLNQDDSAHQAAVAATMKPEQGPSEPTPNLTIVKPPEATLKSDVQLAKEANATGKEVELNDDNQIVDKRELLSAGLNLSAPNTRQLGRSTAKKDINTEEVAVHRAVGTAASRKEINERRQREIQQQLQQENERVAQEQERQERERLERTVAKRNQEGDVQSAKERYLARKRRKLGEGQETPTNAGDTLTAT